MIKPNDFVFPHLVIQHHNDEQEYRYSVSGITLRTYIAIEAMKGMLAAQNGVPSSNVLDMIPKRAFKLADLMIERANYAPEREETIAPIAGQPIVVPKA